MGEVLVEDIARLEYERTYKPGNDLLRGFAGEVKWEEAPDGQRESCYRYAAQILSLFKEAGWVQLHPDQSLPKYPYSLPSYQSQYYGDRLIKEGFRRVILEDKISNRVVLANPVIK